MRVNSVSPGWIDTDYPLDIANAVLYLCSDKAGFINGENICIDGGMTVTSELFHNWGTIEDRREDVNKYMVNRLISPRI